MYDTSSQFPPHGFRYEVSLYSDEVTNSLANDFARTFTAEEIHSMARLELARSNGRRPIADAIFVDAQGGFRLESVRERTTPTPRRREDVISSTDSEEDDVTHTARGKVPNFVVLQLTQTPDWTGDTEVFVNPESVTAVAPSPRGSVVHVSNFSMNVAHTPAEVVRILCQGGTEG